MATKVLGARFSEEEINALEKMAKRRGVAISSLVYDAVKSLIGGETKPISGTVTEEVLTEHLEQLKDTLKQELLEELTQQQPEKEQPKISSPPKDDGGGKSNSIRSDQDDQKFKVGDRVLVTLKSKEAKREAYIDSPCEYGQHKVIFTDGKEPNQTFIEPEALELKEKSDYEQPKISSLPKDDGGEKQQPSKPINHSDPSGLSARSLSKRLGCDRKTLSRWKEKGNEFLAKTSRDRDPDGKAWVFDEETKMYVEEKKNEKT